MLDFMAILLNCSISSALVALLLCTLSPILFATCRAKWLHITWKMGIVAFVIPIRPVFDYRAYCPIFPALTTQDNIKALAAYPLGVVERAGPDPAYNWIFYIWAAGALSVMAFHIIRHIHLIRVSRRWDGEDSNCRQASAVLDEVLAEMRIPKKICVRICPEIASPMIVGLLSPKILLPANYFWGDELAVIFRHELIHFKRKDLWFKALALIACAIHWFNPVIYLTVLMLDLQCELSCDEAVLRGASNDARQKYIGLMTDIALRQNKCRDASPASFYGGKGKLSKRISSIMDDREKRAGLAVALCATLCMVLAGAALSGFAHPSVYYMEKKWRMNTHFNEQVYEKEPHGNGLDEFPFMGAINITYAFDKVEAPLRLGVSAYDVIVIKGVDLTDQWAASALADYCLSTAFGNRESGGLTGGKPRQSQYTYAIELPQDIGSHSLGDFFREPDPLAAARHGIDEVKHWEAPNWCRA